MTLNYDVYRHHYDVSLRRFCVQGVELNVIEIVKNVFISFLSMSKVYDLVRHPSYLVTCVLKVSSF